MVIEIIYASQNPDIYIHKYEIPPVPSRRYNWRGKAAVQIGAEGIFQNLILLVIGAEKAAVQNGAEGMFKNLILLVIQLNLKMKMSQN